MSKSELRTYKSCLKYICVAKEPKLKICTYGAKTFPDDCDYELIYQQLSMEDL